MKEARMRELIYLARCGEGEAYEALYNLYLKIAVKISWELLNTVHNTNFDILELAHCADERFSMVIKRYDERFYTSPSSYFYLCIRRYLIRVLEQNKPVLTISFDEQISEKCQLRDIVADPTPKYNPIEQHNKQMKYEIISKSLTAFDSGQNAIIFCYYWEGYTAKEIAAIVKMPDARSIYNIVYRTISRLKRHNKAH